MSNPPGANDQSDPLISPDLSGWLQRSIGIVKAGWRPLLGLQLLSLAIGAPVLGVLGVQSAFNARGFARSAESSTAGPPEIGNLGEFAGLSLVAGLTTYLLYAVVLLASIRVVVAVATEGKADLVASIRGSARRLLPLMGWQLLAGLLAMVAVCACIFPVFYVLAATAVLAAVVTFERGGVIARCFRLFHGDLGAAVPRVLLIGAVWVAVGMITGLPGALFQPEANTSVEQLIIVPLALTLLQLAGQVVVGIITAPMIVTAYADMRARVEQLSTPVLVAELAQP